ncbi:MAG: hypothetical protein ACR2MO_08195 [Acidimicrobiales bacterium]
MFTFRGSMGRATAAVLVAGAMTVGGSLMTAPPASAHGACRSPEGRVSELVASARVGCATARRVAAAFDAAVLEGGAFPGDGRVAARGFACRAGGVGHESEESFSVRCSSGRNVVRFAWGV